MRLARPLMFVHAFLLWFSLTAAASAQTIKIATVAPEGTHWHQAITDVGMAWEDLSEGAIDFRIFSGGVAGSEADAVRKMRIGQLQGSTLSNLGLAEIVPDTMALSVPLIFRSDGEYAYVRSQLQQQLEEKFEARGYKLITWSDIGWAYIYSTEPVVHPDDLAALPLAAPGSQTTVIDAWRAAGFKPVLISIPELLPSLQTNLVKALFSVPTAALAFQWYQAAPHVTDLKISPVPGALVISNRAWNQIPEDLRPKLLAAAREIGARSEADLPGLEAEATQVMRDRGLTVHAVDAATTAEWERRSRSGSEAVIGSVIPQETMDAVFALIDEYRRQSISE